MLEDFSKIRRENSSVTLRKRFVGFAGIHDGVDEESCRIDLRENRLSDGHVLLKGRK